MGFSSPPGASKADVAAVTPQQPGGVIVGGQGELVPSAVGQTPRWNGTHLVMQNDRVFDARDDGVAAGADNADRAAAILTTMGRAGWNTGASGKSLANPYSTVVLPSGRLALTQPLLINSTWFFSLRGSPEKTMLAPQTSQNTVLSLDGCGYGDVGNFRVQNPTAGIVQQDVILLDESPAANTSVHGLTLHDIMIDNNLGFVRGISIGTNPASLDVAENWIERIIVEGNWTTGNVTTWQQGVTFGSSTAGNVLNHVLRNAQLGKCRYNLYLGSTNVTARDVYFDGGHAAIGGYGNNYFLLDGFRIEDCEMFCDLAGASSAGMEYVFRNGNYVHNLTTATYAANFGGAGNVTFDNVSWGNTHYPTTKATMTFGGSVGRVVTLRNFTAQELPEELIANADANAPLLWVKLDGYSRINSSTAVIATYAGLYTRAVTANATFRPYDGILRCDTTAGPITVTMPPAVWHQGREAFIQKTTADANAVSVVLNGTDTLSGSPGTLGSQWSSLHLRGMAGGWAVVSRS